jgi:hypothetical protein
MADGYEQVYQRVIAERQEQPQSIAIGTPTSRVPLAIAHDDVPRYQSPGT